MQVIEKFVSINGEGLKQGELALFIRFAGCNLRCIYCDTKYSFENPKYEEMSPNDLLLYAKKEKVKNITLTGGEPLIQDGIYELMELLSNEGFNVEVETNGSIDISRFRGIKNASFTLDYKTPVSGMENKMLFKNYELITKNDSVKFVCGTNEDLNRSLKIMKEYNLINKTNCLISPVFGMIELNNIVDFLKVNNLNGVRMCLQIHKIIWDPNKRGV